MTVGLTFLLCQNGKFFGFQKNFFQILRIFSSNKCIFVRLWVKVFVSQVTLWIALLALPISTDKTEII